MADLIKQELSSIEQRKVKNDLTIIDSLTKIGRRMGLRVVIHGGYATDGFLGEITRPHDDIDVEIYGVEQNADEVIDKLITQVAASLMESWAFTTEDKGKKDYYHNLLIQFENTSLDIYYTQTKTSPLGKEKIIVKKDGSLSNQEFGDLHGKLGNISFEIQDPLTGAVDKIYKRDHRGDPKQDKHEQDIENLKEVVPSDQIKKRILELTTKTTS